MNGRVASSSAVLAAGIGITTLMAVSSFGQNVHVRGTADGPYRYKSQNDRIEIIGFVTEIKGADDAVFRDCGGKTRNVKRHDLKRIQRDCPSGSPVTPWIVDAGGKLVPAPGYALDNAYLTSGKAQIDPAGLTAVYRAELNEAKRGDRAAISWASEKGIWIIAKPHQQ
jgi:hypothetical protein